MLALSDLFYLVHLNILLLPPPHSFTRAHIYIEWVFVPLFACCECVCTMYISFAIYSVYFQFRLQCNFSIFTQYTHINTHTNIHAVHILLYNINSFIFMVWSASEFLDIAIGKLALSSFFEKYIFFYRFFGGNIILI